MNLLEEFLEDLSRSKQSDMLCYYQNIANGHKQKLLILSSSLLALAQLFLLFPIQYADIIKRYDFDFLLFLVFIFFVSFFIVVVFIHQLSNFFTATTNRLLTEANCLMHYYENSNKDLVALDHKLRDGKSFTPELAFCACLFIFIAFVVFFIKLSKLILEVYDDKSVLLIWGILIGIAGFGILVLFAWVSRVIIPRAKKFKLAQELLLGLRAESDPKKTIDNVMKKLSIKNDLNKDMYSQITKAI